LLEERKKKNGGRMRESAQPLGQGPKGGKREEPYKFLGSLKK